MTSQVTTATGDFFKDAFPKSDIISMGNILHDWDEDQKIGLMRKAFDALPGKMKEYIYQRLYDILTGKDDSPDYAEITRKTGREILEIPCDTKKDLPSYWKK